MLLIEKLRGLKLILTRTTFLFGRSILMACFSAILALEHLITSFRLFLLQICWQHATTFLVELFTTAVALSFFATGKRTATFFCRLTTTIFTAFIICAICTENSPSGPVLMTTTF